MCVNPATLPNGLMVSCRECWQCVATYISDWQGRCIAESEDAVGTHLVTLTYGGGDHVDSRVLNYEHVRDYLRKIRKKAKVRYFAVGEYGSEKGRAHWHLLLFWQDKVPEVKLNWSCNQAWWEHGFSKYEVANQGSVRYIMKYMAKDFVDQNSNRAFGMSSHPLLGYRYFARLARQYIDQGLSPQDKYYRFPEVRDKKGAIKEFHMSRNVWLYFAGEYMRLWSERNGDRLPPMSVVIDDYRDLIASQSVVRELVGKKPQHKPMRPWLNPLTGARYFEGEVQEPVAWNELLRHWVYPAEPAEGVTPLYWSFDLDGERAWQGVIRTETWAERRREALERLPMSEGLYRKASRAG